MVVWDRVRHQPWDGTCGTDSLCSRGTEMGNISFKILTSVALFCNRTINCFHSPCWDTDGNHKQWTGPRLYLGYCWRLCNIWSPFGSEHVHRLWINDTQSSYIFHIGSQAWSLCQDSPTDDVQSTDLGHIVVRDHGNSNPRTCHD
jgi:hypothetical protein